MNLKTIAKMAGVSTVTVSNVINGKYSKASEETVQRILQIVEENNYQPSATARSLISKRSRIIGVVIPNLQADESFCASPYNTQILGYLDRYIRNQGYYMMLHCVVESFDALPSFASWNIDGAFLLGVAEQDAQQLLKSLKIPTVFIDTYALYGPMVTVQVADRKGGYLAAKYLLDKGHRRIAFVSPPTKYPGVMQERYRGFREAFAERGLEFPEEHCFYTGGSGGTFYDLGVEAGRAVAKSGGNFTAVAAMADVLALGAMEGLRLEGLRVPQDVSVMGFDDLPECQFSYPKLTSISQNLEEKARRAGDFLFAMLRGEERPACGALVDVALSERQSVISLPGAIV